MSSELIDSLPPDPQALLRLMVQEPRRDDGERRSFAPEALAKRLGWTQQRLRMAQDLLIEVEVIERWPRVVPCGPAFEARLTIAGEALGSHGFSAAEFKQRMRAEAAARTGAVNVNGSEQVTIAVGNGINIGAARLRPLHPTDVRVLVRDAVYVAHEQQLLVPLEIQVADGRRATFCDAALALSTGETLYPDNTMIELGGARMPGFEPAGPEPVEVDGFRRFAWHFYDRLHSIGVHLLERPIEGLLAARCVETGCPFQISCPIRAVS
jgi:hypothetical protein